MFLKILKKALLISIPLLGFFFFILFGTDLLNSNKSNNYIEICDVNGCHKNYSDDTDEIINLRHDVLFYIDNIEVNRESVLTNTTATFFEPKNKDNYIFVGWSLKDNASPNELFDFSTKITKDLKLYGVFILNTSGLVEKITKDTIKSNVKIKKICYNTFLGMTTDSATWTGSGIIFSKNTNGYYFVLTNHHVVEKEENYDKVKYTIIDYLGNEYEAIFKHSSSKYDLGVLYFKENPSIELKKIVLGKNNLDISNDIISLSSPEGQLNAYTFGKIEKYCLVNVTDNEVSFEVIKHSAYTNHGSSGGGVLDINMNLIGLNYAGSFDENGDSICGYAIPIVKIREYLDKYIWSN